MQTLQAGEQTLAPNRVPLSWDEPVSKGLIEQNVPAPSGVNPLTAELVDPVALYNLGLKYATGEGVQLDLARAIACYRESAENGYARAQVNLGCMYVTGQGTSKNSAEALKWFQNAAAQGMDKAKYNLGLIYLRGEGVERDNVIAAKWFCEAAEQGLADAQLNLGLLYEGEPSLSHGPEESAKLYRWAAEQGIAVAQANLGRLYAAGLGLAKNYFEAYKWITIALDRGGLDAPSVRAIRDSIAEDLTSTQLAEIQQLVRTWCAKSWKEVSGDDLSAPVFFITKLIETWRLKQTDAASLLGFGADYQKYVNDLLQGKGILQGQDTEKRIAYLFQLRAILRAFFRDEDVENMWLRKSAPLLDGSKPIDLLLDGSKESFRRVRECVDLLTRRL